MNSKGVRWGTREFKLQVYLPEQIHQALQSYVATEFSSKARVTSAVVRKAIVEFLEKRGYLGGEK